MFSRKLFFKGIRRASDKEPKSEVAPGQNSKTASSSTCESSKSAVSESTLHSHRRSEDQTPGIRRKLDERHVSERRHGIPLEIPTREKIRAPNRAADPQGLSLLHAPDVPAVADIIFVHGLGGSSRLSWSKNKDLDLFWPQEWLPLDHDIQQARIFSFGYNAAFQSHAQAGTTGIVDFAKNLLYDMSYGTDARGDSFHMGRVPIVFVTHSMGGLVFKKAYLEGQLDSHFKGIIRAIKAVIFLSTPHRGSDLAGFLYRLLSMSPVSPKQYVAELVKQGPFLRAVNEQFRHSAPALQIFSFYETLKTSLGLTSAMILDQESSMLGYPGEISRSLNADHHGVCKFESPQDTNYRVVLSALKAILSPYTSSNSQVSTSDLGILETFLSVQESAADQDLSLFWGRRAESTCTWVLKRPEIKTWLSSSSTSQLIWVHGRPGRGKSVMASFLTHHLREQGSLVQHFFFRNGDETKRSISALLRSLASQMAIVAPGFRRPLLELAGSGWKFREADWRATWKRIFTGLLFQVESLPTLYWIIDGMDESGSPQHVLDMLGDINNSSSPIKCLVTSRWTPQLSSAYDRAKSHVSSSILPIDHDATDIRLYVEKRLRYVSWNSSIKDEIMVKVLLQANDNFLWVCLILEEINDCHTEEDVRSRLQELPQGMEELYKHMEEIIRSIRRPSDKSLCRQLLLWAVHSRRALTIEELAALLEQEFGQLLDISNTISRLCGHFVVIEGGNRMALLHQSAREYLTTTTTLPFSLDSSIAHCELFERSLFSFMDKANRAKLTSPTTMALDSLEYRVTSWPYHLQSIKSPNTPDSQLDLLLRFFNQQFVLHWIKFLAIRGHLRILIEASYALSAFVLRIRRPDVARPASLQRSADLALLDVWAKDLLKLAGKFGSILAKDPDSIFTSVAPFSPRTSAIHAHSAKAISSLVTVRGLEEDWDDCLARISVSSDHFARLLDCSGHHVAIVDDIGIITLWDCITFQKIRHLEHSERVSSICFNLKGDRLVTYGTVTTRIWSPQTGELLHQFDNPRGVNALCLSFADKDKSLLMASDRRCMLRYTFEHHNVTWETTDATLLNDGEILHGTNLNNPSSVSISPDGSMVAAAYRRFPLTVWSIDPPRLLKRVSREHAKDRPSTLLPFASKVTWHPNNEELLGLFLDGFTFRFNVLDGTIREQPPDPARMPADIQCSPDGLIYAIRGVRGAIKLYDYQSSALIYQLTTTRDSATALCFSKDGRRFLQLHGHHCTIWEPNSLIRLSAADDHAVNSQSSPGDSEDQSHIVSEAASDDMAPIMLVSASPVGSLVCYGDEDGLIELLDHETCQKLEIGRTATGMSIEHLTWSSSGTHLCYSEISGRVTVVEVTASGGTWEHRRVKRFKPKIAAGGIVQILLASDAAALLVVYRDSAQIWSVESGTLLSTCDGTAGARWVAHSGSIERILSFGTNNISVYSWTDMDLVSRCPWPQAGFNDMAKQIETGLPQIDFDGEGLNTIQEEVDRVVETHFSGHILVIITRRARSRIQAPRLQIIDVASPVCPGAEAKEQNFTSIDISPEITAEASIPLNILANGRFVFIDRFLGLCTWHIRSTRGARDITRHFYIPRDWLPDNPSKLLHVTAKGTILCPRKGGLATIESSIASAW